MRTMDGPMRDESGDFGKNIARGVKIVLVMGLVATAIFAWRPAGAAGPTVTQLDVKVNGLWVTDSPGGGTGIIVAKEGDDVYIHCSWFATTTYSDYYVAKDIKFTNAINIDGKLLATVNGVVTANHWGKGYVGTPGGSFISQKWKAAGPGKHAIQCQLDLTNQFKEKPEWKQDSQRTIQLVVRREVKEGEIPAPRILNPPAGSKYQLGDHLKIPVGFRVDDAFFKLAKDMIIPELWFRMELEYDGPPGVRGVQKKTITLSGGAPFSAGSTQLSNNPVEDFLTIQAMKKKGLGGEGNYTLTVYLSSGGKNGPKARRSFNIFGPLSVKGKTGTETRGASSPPPPAPRVPIPLPKIPPQPPKAR